MLLSAQFKTIEQRENSWLQFTIIVVREKDRSVGGKEALL